MSTNTTALDFNAVDTTAAPAAPGLLRRFFDRMIEARKAHGEAHVRAYLNSLSDERLADLGFSRIASRRFARRTVLPIAIGCNQPCQAKTGRPPLREAAAVCCHATS